MKESPGELPLPRQPRVAVVHDRLREGPPLLGAEDVLPDAVAHLARLAVDQERAAAAEDEVGLVLDLPVVGPGVEERIVIAHCVDLRLLRGVEIAAAALGHLDDQVGAGEPPLDHPAGVPDAVDLQRRDSPDLLRVDPGGAEERAGGVGRISRPRAGAYSAGGRSGSGRPGVLAAILAVGGGIRNAVHPSPGPHPVGIVPDIEHLPGCVGHPFEGRQSARVPPLLGEPLGLSIGQVPLQDADQPREIGQLVVLRRLPAEDVLAEDADVLRVDPPAAERLDDGDPVFGASSPVTS